MQVIEFFFFINTRSGDGQGKTIITLSKSLQINGTALYFVDLFNTNQKQQALNILIKKQHLKNVRIIVCGGDGTISWVLNQLYNFNIPLYQVILGVLPIGTGNDFCRSNGWGGTGFNPSHDALLNRIYEWKMAQIGNYDIWSVEIQSYKSGAIFTICSKEQKKLQKHKLQKIFTNYVGLGIDARVVYTMQQYRTSFACINKILYGLVGCFKFFRPLKKLTKKISSFTQTQSSQEKPLINIQKLQTQQLQLQNSICSGNDTSRVKANLIQQIEQKNILTKGSFRGLVCLNCTSYMAGLRNVWKTKKTTSVDDKDWKQQETNDGMIQFVTYRSQLQLALERLRPSGSKLAQGKGPFQVRMKQPKKKEEISFMQIDGQSIRVSNLQRIEIRHCSKIGVLKKK